MSDSKLDAINAAIAQAKEAAANSVPATTAVAPGAAGTAVATAAPVTPGRAVTMREMVSSAKVRVDEYLKLEKTGFLIGKDLKNPQDKIKVSFKISEAKPYYAVRYGNPAKYERSYDRQVNAQNGKPWHVCVAQAQALDPRCRGDYRSVDVPFTVLETVTAKDGKVLIEEGKKLGWTSSITNFDDFLNLMSVFYKLIDEGLMTEDTVIAGTIVHDTRENGDNVWGVVTFDGFEVAELGSEEAEA